MHTITGTQSVTQTYSPNIMATIGKTPLVHLSRLGKEWDFTVYGKMEGFNPGGSIKDRTAINMLLEAMEKGEVHHGDTIIESSSGNMALGLAQVCKFYKLQLIVVIDPKVNLHTEKILEVYGVKLVKVTHPQPEGGYLESRILKVKELLKQYPNSHSLNQYENAANPQTHYETMSEIAHALNKKIDYVFISTSTCGTLMGCAKYIYENRLATKIIAVDAKGSVTFGQKESTRLIPGHGSGKASHFLDDSFIHDIMHVSDEACITGCWNLLEQEAILCGGSSGAVVSAIEKYAPFIPAGASCVAILCDRGDRYLETVYNKTWVHKHFPYFNFPQKETVSNT
ncbi:2,3-diaminopropionate biosynthesis protein SbnA [Planktosalinus lacus]|uniref:N-(2-amino-2-carboxyethyl)-L-glutamate synthase n=1 Tax=Planktosalinus lacus TaxID=1526573 RepID=A0A8J2VAW8_9FLAO|nr:2,3-diaminopropionate biosynthesis protein SbnA [Planktosalinus lacus]GGD93662.1 2,3-diaminopropionate biosynthesis protein SbnA [Planktosalinus lacus]